MTYYFLEKVLFGETKRYILLPLSDGGTQSFHDTETNDGPERRAYLAWVAEGNTAEEWNPQG